MFCFALLIALNEISLPITGDAQVVTSDLRYMELADAEGAAEQLVDELRSATPAEIRRVLARLPK